MIRLLKISSNFSHKTLQPKVLLVFGAPGVGKGTYSKMLEKDLKLNHISTGDEIRKILKGSLNKNFDSKILSKIQSIVKSGGLVNDEIKLHQAQSANGIILDGFPRTIQQLQKYMKKSTIHKVLNLTLREDVLIEKLMGRRTCKGCGFGFNVCDIQRDGYSMQPMLPKKQNICDHCGNQLIIRDDDTQKVIKSRMKQYEIKTKPLLKQFERLGILVNFEPKNGVKDYPKLIKLVQKQLNLENKI